MLLYHCPAQALGGFSGVIAFGLSDKLMQCERFRAGCDVHADRLLVLCPEELSCDAGVKSQKQGELPDPRQGGAGRALITYSSTCASGQGRRQRWPSAGGDNVIPDSAVSGWQRLTRHHPCNGIFSHEA